MNDKNLERYFEAILEVESEHMLWIPEDLPRFKNGRINWEGAESFSTTEFEQALAYFRQQRDDANFYIEAIYVLIGAKGLLKER
ncbi:MAG: hypothetical protein ACKO6H_04800 [Betaproteobacteria bacterium]